MFKRIVHELQVLGAEAKGLNVGLALLVNAHREGPEGGGDAERLLALEGAIERLRGEMDASIIKAESIRGAARAAEDRGRGHMKRAEAALEAVQSVESGEDEDSFETIGKAFQDYLPPGDDEGVEALPAVSNGVAERRQSLTMARQAKRRTG